MSRSQHDGVIKVTENWSKMTIVSVKSKFCEPEKIFILLYTERKLVTLFVLINLK